MITLNNRGLCENCFSPINSPGPFCPNCGYSHSQASNRQPLALPISSVLIQKYVIGKVLGMGGFGITYLAYDVTFNRRIAIKEYYPAQLSSRYPGRKEVISLPGEKSEDFKKGAKRFYEEAELISRFNGNPNIINVYEFFYDNKTAYYAMEYLDGEDLVHFLKSKGRPLTEGELLYLLDKVTDALMIVHSTDTLHRDITPDNIYVCNDGRIKLIDFGAARHFTSQESQSLSVIVKEGFAPVEQYQKNGKQGPWTDIYALGATSYYLLTGRKPPGVFDRMQQDTLRFPVYNEELARTLYKMVAVSPENRPKNIIELKASIKKISLQRTPLVIGANPTPVNHTQIPTPAPIPNPAPTPTPVSTPAHMPTPALTPTPAPIPSPAPTPTPVSTPAHTPTPASAPATNSTPVSTPNTKPEPKPDTAPDSTPNPKPDIAPDSIPNPKPEPKPNSTPDPVQKKDSSTPPQNSSTKPKRGKAKVAIILISIILLVAVAFIGFIVIRNISNGFSPSFHLPQQESLEFDLFESGYSVTGRGSVKGNRIVIPETYNGKPVTSIAAKAFSGENITYVKIPDSITTIGYFAFQGCSELKEVKLSSNLTFIGKEAFAGTAITSISIPVSVTNIDERAFENCENLKNITYEGSRDQWEKVKVKADNPTLLNLITFSIQEESTAKETEQQTELQTEQQTELQTPVLQFAPSGTGYMVTGIGTVTDKWIYIPETYNGKPVIGITDWAFCDENIESVVIPDSVTYIGDYAFCQCTELSLIDLPDSLQSIGSHAFRNTAIESVTIPDSVTYIGDYAFCQCTELSSIDLPDSLQSIGPFAFNNTAVESVTIPDSVTEIGYNAFSHCGNLFYVELPDSLTTIEMCAFEYTSITSIELPDSLTTIEMCAFEYTPITSISIPVSVTEIGINAFFSCNNLQTVIYEGSQSQWEMISINSGNDTLKNLVTFAIVESENLEYKLKSDGTYEVIGIGSYTEPDLVIPSTYNGRSVTSIGERAFSGLRITSVVIPDSVTLIRSYAFSDCAQLSSVKLSSNLKTIGDHAFYVASTLTSITIPKNVTEIGEFAFYNCNKLKNVVYEGSQSQWNSIAIGSWNDAIKNNVTFIGGTSPSVQDLAYKLKSDNTYEVIGIGNYTGKNLVIPSTHSGKAVTSIAANAFKKNTGITSVTVSAGISAIGQDAFNGCENLASVTFPDTLKSIGDNAFRACAITSVIIPENVTSIGTNAFTNCTSLTQVSYNAINCNPDWYAYDESDNKYYYYTIFYNCPLNYVSIGNKVKVIPDGLFYDTDTFTFTNITIPDSVEIIGNSAFKKCAITSVIIPNSVKTIGNDAFRNCALTSITIPENITSIGKDAFVDCTSLTQVSYNAINCNPDWYAYDESDNKYYYYTIFRNCPLNSISIGNRVEIIPEGLFFDSGTFMFTTVTIPDSVRVIDKQAFYNCMNLLTINIRSTNLSNVGSFAFKGCTRLITIKYAGSPYQWSSITVNEGNENFENAILTYYAQ